MINRCFRKHFFNLRRFQTQNDFMFSITIRIFRFIIFAYLFFPFWLTAQVSPGSGKISLMVQNQLRAQNKIPVVIYFSQASVPRTAGLSSKSEKAVFVHEQLREFSIEKQRDAIAMIEQSNTVYQSYHIVNALAATLDRSLIEQLSTLKEVVHIALDAPVRLDAPVEQLEFSSNNAVPEWGIQVIRADKVWEKGIRGQGVVIGGQDTGYDWNHPAIKSKYRGLQENGTVSHDYNWHDAIHELSPLNNDTILLASNNPCGLDVKFPCDDGQHGTHTMGTMVGEDEMNQIGVAPMAQWIGCRNMERGWGKPSTYMECFEWFLAPTDLDGQNPDPALAPHVINNSWYCPELEGCDPGNWIYMEMAVQNLRNAGVFVVVSAGNNGNACGRINAPPAMFESSFAVAATAIQDTVEGQFIDAIAGYSSWGPVTVDNSNRMKPDISAPGSRVRSSIPPDGYASFSGTSMAGPHVAGVVALVISANPHLAGKVNEIQDILELTADPMTRQDSCGSFTAAEIPNFIYGHGRINALNAVEMAMNMTTEKRLNRQEAELLFAPNPVTNTMRISWDTSQDQAIAKITDINGISYAIMKLQNNGQIDLSFLPSGIYILKLNLNGFPVSGQFVKI